MKASFVYVALRSIFPQQMGTLVKLQGSVTLTMRRPLEGCHFYLKLRHFGRKWVHISRVLPPGIVLCTVSTLACFSREGPPSLLSVDNDIRDHKLHMCKYIIYWYGFFTLLYYLDPCENNSVYVDTYLLSQKCFN